MLWAQSTKKDYIRAEHKLHSISRLLISQVITPQVMFFLAYLYSAGTQYGSRHPAGWPSLFCGPTQETCVSHSQHRRNWEKFWNKCRWMDQKGRNKQEGKKFLAVSVACMATYQPTPGFKGRTFKLCVLTRWDCNFSVSSSPLRGWHVVDTLMLNSWHQVACGRQFNVKQLTSGGMW